MKKYKNSIIVIIVILVIFFGLNFLIDEGIINRYIKGLLTLSCINIIMAIALNLITGITGQLSLGNAGFMAIGAYTSVYFSVKVGTPFYNINIIRSNFSRCNFNYYRYTNIKT